MSKLVPLGDRIIMKQVDGEKITPGGLILPDSAQKPPRTASWSPLDPESASRTAKPSQ